MTNLDFPKNLMPSDIAYCINTIAERIENKQTQKVFRHKEELEECILHDYDFEKLEKTLTSLVPYKYQPYTLYRIISNKALNYMLTVFYMDKTSSEHVKLTIPEMKDEITSIKSLKTPFLFQSQHQNNKTHITIKSVNSAKNTVINNVIETFEKHDEFPEYIELWYITGKDKAIKSLYIVNGVINALVLQQELDSLHNDFERYLHRYIKPMSVFDIVAR